MNEIRIPQNPKMLTNGFKNMEYIPRIPAPYQVFSPLRTVLIFVNLFSKGRPNSYLTLDNIPNGIDYSSVLVGALVGAATLVTAMAAAVAKLVVLGVTEAIDLVIISLTALGSSLIVTLVSASIRKAVEASAPLGLTVIFLAEI